MSNAILVTPALSDAGTITGSQGVGDMTISNLQKRSLKRIWRTEILTPEINLDLGTAQAVDFIALISHNGTGSVTVRAGNTVACDDFASGTLDLITGGDVGLTSNIFFLKLDVEQSYQFWKIQIDDTGNSSGYFEARRLYIGKSFQPQTNIDYGLSEGFIDQSRVTRTRSGEPVPVARDPYKITEFRMSFASEDEMYGTLHDIDRLRGLSKDILFIPVPDSAYVQKRHVYGLMTGMQPITNRAFRLFEKTYSIEEIPA